METIIGIFNRSCPYIHLLDLQNNYFKEIFSRTTNFPNTYQVLPVTISMTFAGILPISRKLQNTRNNSN